MAGVPIRAISVGGIETCIELPSWQLCFDIGRCPDTAVRYGQVLFTHAHVDHMGGVVHHCAQRDLLGMAPPTYWVPAESHDAFEEMLAVWRRLAHSALPCVVRAVSPGDRVPLSETREVVVFRAVHRIPTVGYALVERRDKLKRELEGLPGPEIGRRKRSGEVITEVREQVVLAFCGDTTVDVVDRERWVREAQVLVLEVTFLDDSVSVDHARTGGHVHVDELVARRHLLHNEAVVCTHASRRHPGPVVARLREALPTSTDGPRFVALEADGTLVEV